MSTETFDSARERIIARLDALESEWEALHADFTRRDGNRMGEIQNEQMRLHVELRELHRLNDSPMAQVAECVRIAEKEQR
jgi:hypothetical protein